MPWKTYGEDEDAGEDLVGDLDDHVGDEEGLPAVGFAGSLADLVERALADEKRHDLVDQRGEDRSDHEHGEEHVLHALLGSIGIVERESNLLMLLVRALEREACETKV